MTLAEIVFQQKKLEQKYGVEGKVAGRYVEAGFHVRMNVNTKHGRVSFVAIKGGEKLAVDVVSGKKVVGREELEAIKRKAESLGARPVLVLYGSGVVLGDDAKEFVRENNVAVKRVRG